MSGVLVRGGGVREVGMRGAYSFFLPYLSEH